VIAFANQHAIRSSSMSIATSIFSPSPEQVESIFTEYLDPALSMCDIASRHGTTIEGLSSFLSRPDISERLNDLEAALAERARAAAAHHLAALADAMKNIP
jgi:hypothetical protein